MIVNDLEKEIRGANKWLDNNHDIKLLHTQKEGVRFLINNINSKEKQLRKSIKKIMLELLKEGYFNKAMVYGNEDEVNDIINEISNKVSNKNKSTIMFSYKDWEIYKPYKLTTKENELTSYINAIAKLLIELINSPDKLSDNLHQELSLLLDRINNIPAMTFDEEVIKLFYKEKILLIEFDAGPINVSNENGVAVKNKDYQENWELFLWWVISKNNFCRCILHGSANNFSIIGLEDNVKKVVELYEFKRKEIMDNSIENANKQVRRGLMSLIPISKDKKTYDQNAVHEIKSRTDGYIKDNLLLTIYNQLSDILLKERMNNNDSEVDAFIKGRFPNLGHKYCDIR